MSGFEARLRPAANCRFVPAAALPFKHPTVIAERPDPDDSPAIARAISA
jgi:hypothetical protein